MNTASIVGSSSTRRRSPTPAGEEAPLPLRADTFVPSRFSSTSQSVATRAPRMPESILANCSPRTPVPMTPQAIVSLGLSARARVAVARPAKAIAAEDLARKWRRVRSVRACMADFPIVGGSIPSDLQDIRGGATCNH
jgi:hypothetical protein